MKLFMRDKNLKAAVRVPIKVLSHVTFTFLLSKFEWIKPRAPYFPDSQLVQISMDRSQTFRGDFEFYFDTPWGENVRSNRKVNRVG